MPAALPPLHGYAAGPPARRGAPRMPRPLAWGLFAALAVWSLLVAFVFVEPVWRPFNDSAVYILAARSLASGHGYAYLGEPFFQHPPGLSVLLAPLVRDGIDFAALNQLVALCAAGSFVAAALALGRLHGAALGALAALLFALDPLAVSAQNAVLTEYPFLLLFFAGAWLLTPAARDARGRADAPVGLRRGLLGAVLIAASVHLRTVGLVALPAMALADLFRRGPRRGQGALLAGFALLLCLPWLVHARTLAGQSPPATQFKAFDYATAMFHVDGQDPGSPLIGASEWGARIASNAESLVATVGNAFLGGVQGVPALLATLLLALALLFAWIDRRSMLDWYALGSVVLLLLMYFYDDRFVLPLLPLLISALLHGATRLGRACFSSPLAASGPACVLAAGLGCMCLTGLGAARAEPDARADNRRTDEAVAAWLVEHTAPDARVLADRAAVISVLSGRTVYSYRHLRGGSNASWPAVDWAVLGPGRVPIEERLRAAARAPTALDVSVRGRSRTLRVYELGESPPGN